MIDERTTVRLRTRRLAERMGQVGLTAHRLHLLADGPTKRTINRWLSRGAGSPDGVIPARADHVEAVADVLGVVSDELIDGSTASVEDERFMRLAAALGPRVYPDLMADLGVRADIDALDAGRRLERLSARGAKVREYRFRRWAYCLDILQDGTELPAGCATRGLQWCEAHGLTADLAPELHCMMRLRTVEVRAAVQAGVAWMRRASAQGVFAEVAWVGERLLAALDSEPSPLAAERTEVIALLGRALRLLGRPQQALAVATEAALSTWLLADPLLTARIDLEIARSNYVLGQVYAGCRSIEQAIRRLELLDLEQAGEVLVEALQEHAYLSERLGDFAGASRSLERQRDLARHLDESPPPRHLRLLGLSALDRGAVSEALGHFLEALDIADACGDEREGGLGALNVALGLALSGRAREAEAYFERAAAFVSSGEVGPYAVGLVHMNFGEFALEQGRLPEARRLLRIAHEQLRLAGHFPGLRARCGGLMAEVEVAQGDSAAARERARGAYQDALSADNPLWIAFALVAYALAHRDLPDRAAQWADAPMEALSRLPDDLHCLDRVAIARRAAQVLLGGPRDDEARVRLAALLNQSRRLGLETERARIELLLAGGGGASR